MSWIYGLCNAIYKEDKSWKVMTNLRDYLDGVKLAHDNSLINKIELVVEGIKKGSKKFI
jgi:hypothetical protein